jgi:general nucleoside transport system permease protein
MSTNITARIQSSLSGVGKDGPGAGGSGGAGRRKLSYPTVLLIIAGALVFLSALRAITDVDDLTSFGQYSAALGWAVPIGLAGLGGLWSERAGVINIGLEGMMMLGTFGAGWIGWQHGPWAAVAAGILGGALGGLVHAVATVTFGVDHIVSGVAVNILALGMVQFLAKL